jgi:hypothetical protein
MSISKFAFAIILLTAGAFAQAQNLSTCKVNASSYFNSNVPACAKITPADVKKAKRPGIFLIAAQCEDGVSHFSMRILDQQCTKFELVQTSEN